MSPEHIQTVHTSSTSVPLLREESAAKRGCKHQAGGQKDGGGVFQTALLNKRGQQCSFTYHRPTSPTWTGAFKTGNRYRETRWQNRGEQDGRKYWPKRPRSEQPAATPTFMKAFCSRAFMMTGGMAGKIVQKIGTLMLVFNVKGHEALVLSMFIAHSMMFLN